MLFNQSTWANPPAPTTGAFCPPGSFYDGANCNFGKPAAGQSFIWDNNFYSKPLSGNTCQSPQWFDGANCYLRPIPSAHQGFIYQNGWYTKTNPHFTYRSSQCPANTTYDGANCYRGEPPSGKTAAIRYGYFGFKRSFYANCKNIMSGADGSIDPTFCKVHSVPSGHSAFIYENKWYTEPTPGGSGNWWAKTDLGDSNEELRQVCKSDTSNRNWVLDWSDEFEDQPSGKTCYTSPKESPQCVYKAWWGFERCSDAPVNWTSKGRSVWSPFAKDKFEGIANLNKCRWLVYDQFNQWDSSNKVTERTNSFLPNNIKISGGILKMQTRLETKPSTGWDCGRQLEPNPTQNGNLYTKVCPHSGANISSDSGLPWTASNDPNSPNPDSRYVGRTPGYGRVEFRAKINAIGHGAWPSLWLWGDDSAAPGGHGELDALEYLADLKGDSNQIVKGSATYGTAMQTTHNWGVDSQNYPHTSDGVGIPISVGEWHVYAVEFEPDEIRMYIDGCLRNRLREGDKVFIKPWDRPNTDTASYRPFKLPKNKKYNILIGNPASAASWLPSWYRAYGGASNLQRTDFKPTYLEVDYVRAYHR